MWNKFSGHNEMQCAHTQGAPLPVLGMWGQVYQGRKFKYSHENRPPKRDEVYSM